MSKISITGRRPLSFLRGLIVGLFAGLLITIPHIRQASAPSHPDPVPRPSDVDRLSPEELETLAFQTLSTLSKKRGTAADCGAGAEEYFHELTTNSLQQAQLGIKNARRRLPLAKRLLLDALREAQEDGRLKRSGLSREKRLLKAVNKIALDPELNDMAEVWEGNLSEIRVGSDYALDLISDDEAIFLLGHELMHVAARSGRLNRFIEQVAETARLSANVEPTEKQKEDLACDYTGAEVLKRFIALHPTTETETERFSRVLGYAPRSERLARAWDDFCASYNGDIRDEDHLSQAQTVRALFVLDPKLKTLMPDDSVSSSFCR